jgi:hypothetical protein
MLTRQGNTPTPDGTWTAFSAIPSNGATVGGTARYIQYRADLSTGNTGQTPSLQDMSIACVTCGDPTAPVAVTNLSVTRASTGAHDGRTPLLVAFTRPGNATTVQVYRAPFGDYPRYDDAGGSTPQTPAYPPPAPWVLTSITAPGQTDDPPTRDVWHYVVFTANSCGIVSPVSNKTVGIPNYFLGDVTDGVGPCTGDGLVNTLDLSLLGAHYGQALTGTEPWTCLDMGPTVDGSPDTRPLTDGLVEFEDLIILAISLSDASPPTASLHPASLQPLGADRDRLTVTAPTQVQAGELFPVTLNLSGTGAVRGLSAQLVWDAAVATPQGATPGAMLSDAGGLMYSPKPGRVDGATTGSFGLTGEGVFATVMFRANASGNPVVALGHVDARDGRNQPVDVGQGLPVTTRPATTAFGPIVPNPVSDQAMMSFTLAADGPVDLSLFSVDGRRVASLVHETRPAGVYHVPWDGRSTSGGRLPQGLYYARLVTPQGRFTRSIIVVR